MSFEQLRKYGFLVKEPLRRLGIFFDEWENILDNLVEDNKNNLLRDKVNKLPLLDHNLLNDDEIERAVVVLTFIAHVYVWGTGDVCDTLPDVISIPLCALSEKLNMPPLGTYASTILWNWKLIDPSLAPSLDNLDVLHTFSGTNDERWFYIVTVAIEAVGAKILNALIDINLSPNITRMNMLQYLIQISDSLNEMVSIMKRLPDKMDPNVFYWKIRPYFAGWLNMEDAGLTHGVYYQGSHGARKYAGISAAQSALFRAIDIVLGIEHNDAYLENIYQYMPKYCVEFLQWIYPLKTTIRTRAVEDETLKTQYNLCLQYLSEFRSVHIQYVARYAVVPSKNIMGKEFGLAKPMAAGGGVRGAGGTHALPFLKEIRNNTDSQKIT